MTCSTARLLLPVLSVALAACAAQPPSTAATARPATPGTMPSAPPPAPAPAAAPAITRIDAGASPGSNTHRWGFRSFELRTTAAGPELRFHDAWSFQGSGMQPHQMPAVNHQCSPWEPIPAAVVAAVPGGARSCVEPAGACAPLTRWLSGTTPVQPAAAVAPRPASPGLADDMPLLEPETTSSYGRGFGSCGG